MIVVEVARPQIIRTRVRLEADGWHFDSAKQMQGNRYALVFVCWGNN